MPLITSTMVIKVLFAHRAGRDSVTFAASRPLFLLRFFEWFSAIEMLRFDCARPAPQGRSPGSISTIQAQQWLGNDRHRRAAGRLSPTPEGQSVPRFRQPAPPREDSKNSGKINQRRMMGVRRALESAGVKFIRKVAAYFSVHSLVEPTAAVLRNSRNKGRSAWPLMC